MELFYIYGNLENNLKIKKLLFDTDGPFCVYCYKRFLNYQEKGLTIDHVIPRRFGGSNRLHNLVLCCDICNSTKKEKGGKELSALTNYLWQKRRVREMIEKVRKETIPRRVLLRLPREVRNGYIRPQFSVNERLLK